MVLGPLWGEHQEFHSVCIQDEVVTPKINAQASAPIPHPLCCELAISRTKRGGSWSNHGQSYLLSLTSVISIPAARMPTLMSTHPLSIYIEFFTLLLSRKLWETSAWTQRVSCSPILEESHMSDAGSTMNNSHFVALPQSHSPPKFVPLGWCWCTWPSYPAQPYGYESPLLE